MAEAFAKKHGGKMLEVLSSALNPLANVNHNASASMKELGYNLSEYYPVGLDNIPDVQYDYVITIGDADEYPVINAENRENWVLPDLKHMELDELNKVRDIIETEIINLIKQLQ